MKNWFTLGAIALLAGVTLLVLPAQRPAAAPAADPGWEPADAVAWSDPDAAQVARDLDARRVAAMRRSEAKVALVEALLRGDLTLAEAADQFRTVNAAEPTFYGPLRDCYPGATDEELCYRQVVLFVRGMVRVHRAAVEARLPDLEAELARRFPADPSKTPPAAG